MTRTQIQLPEPLLRKLRGIAKRKDISLAEVIRRASENYADTWPDDAAPAAPWTMPVLKKSGGWKADPATMHVEADAIMERCDIHHP